MAEEKVDFGGSPATPYFGEEGRADKTAKARDEVDADDVEDSTGVDRTSPHNRDRDEAGREVLPAQFVPGKQAGESAEPKDAPKDADSGKEEVRGDGETDSDTSPEEAEEAAVETAPKGKKDKANKGKKSK